MKEKKLYSSAIIPDELYVQREADRKLKEIILRMSKPAYVSVARQMGKTNLLIQTKRALETKSNRFVYIDITNKFDSAQDCFRYIVNQILTSNEEIKEFNDASQIILERRKNNSAINPTEEYQNEIREILKHHKGNLVVFLDEVDDLRKHSFSDDIFGQVRKTYFINETYPVLKRVTYVLSGVIDPEKLIKTKDNSPFNIAIPVYLDDFTYDEFLEFTNKSELLLDSEIKEYMYAWLRGNPRMTFEILSIIEDQILAGEIVSKNSVDKAISDFYLTNFKNPPIDHIRDLIKHNTEVRKGLIKLRQGQVNDVSDDVINKFYLFGITSTKLNRADIKIKNKVIESSLSDEWLSSIELEKKGYYEYGKDKIAQGYHEEGIKILQEYLQNDPNGGLVSLAKYDIGKAYYDIGNYELSNQYFLDKPIKKETSPEIYYWQVFYIGVNYLKLENAEFSIAFFDEIINECTIPQICINAIINKGECLLSVINESKIGIDSIEAIYLNALEYIEKYNNIIEEKDKLLSATYFRLGYLNRNKEKSNAVRYFESSYKHASNDERPTILLFIAANSTNSEFTKEIYSRVSTFIIENKITYKESPAIIACLSEFQIEIIFEALIVHQLWDDFEKLLTYSLNFLYSQQISQSEFLYRLALSSLKGSYEAARYFCNRIVELPDSEISLIMRSFQLLGLIETKDRSLSLKYLERYVQLFSDNNNFDEKIERLDFTAFIRLIESYRERGEVEKGFKVASVIEKHFVGLSSEIRADSVVIMFFILDYYNYVGDIEKSLSYSDALLKLISEVRPTLNELSYIDGKALQDIEMQAKAVRNRLTTVKPIMPIKIDRQLGRNEYVKVRYKNGKEVVAKYKKVSDDIDKGECIIINK